MSYHQHVYFNNSLIKDNDALFRYLPPYPENTFYQWLKTDLNLKSGSWIIDPFGASPDTALELASRGYRVLMVSNNPIINFITEVLAQAPDSLEFKAALSELSKIRRGDEWLDQHLSRLYLTRCPLCNAFSPAEAFLWRKGDLYPYASIYHCEKCQGEGEKPCTQEDFDLLNHLGSDKLHRARALQRVVDINDDAKNDVLEILENYPTRPLYFISTLINKIEGSSLPENRRKLLYALVLSICDQGNAMWGHPGGRSRPKQLMTPPVYRENNLWITLESAIGNWCRRKNSVDLKFYPAFPEQSGICLYPARLRTLTELPPELNISAVACILPRPNQAFWSLSAIWSGWLWGKENVEPLKAMLERKRFDWNWLENALTQSFSHLNQILPRGTPFFSVFSELDAGFISAGVRAASLGGLSIYAAALSEEDDILHTWWLSQPERPPAAPANLENSLRQSLISFLSQIVEPASYTRLLVHALLESAADHSLNKIIPRTVTSTAIRFIQNSFDAVLNSTPAIVAFSQERTGIETRLWGLRQPLEILSLSDQVEMQVVNLLQKKPLQTSPEIEEIIFSLFPGLMTPTRELIDACLESYAEAVVSSPAAEIKWQLHSREQPATRKNDIETIINFLQKIGASMGYQVNEQNPQTWNDRSGEIKFTYHIIASSILSKHVFGKKATAGINVIVLPGSRSRLLSYKLEKDPNLKRILHEGGWRFLKFRHVRNLAGKSGLPAERWLDLINLDPPLWEDAIQMSIFPS
ncbi:MAG: hypothetical protein LWX83_04835 [Anaerolineae bacterium]|nr:hypothetical protein [Anaerolineae bacterium]